VDVEEYLTPEYLQGKDDDQSHFNSELLKYDPNPKEGRDTHQLLECLLNDTILLTELQGHARTGNALSSFPRLYKWVCRRVYCLRTDQQILEAGFNLIDLFCQTKSRPELMFGQIKATEREHTPRTSSETEQLSIRKECRARRTDFGTPAHIRATVSPAVLAKRAQWVQAEKERLREQRRRCAGGCICGKCFECEECKAKGIHKLYKLQRTLDKHIKTEHGDDGEETENQNENEEEAGQDPEPSRCYCDDDNFVDLDSVQCDGCEIWFHLECLASYDGFDLSIEDVAEGGAWFCSRAACKEKEDNHKEEQEQLAKEKAAQKAAKKTKKVTFRRPILSNEIPA
jgi:hypothetical protein